MNPELLQLALQLPVVAIILAAAYYTWREVSAFFERQAARQQEREDKRDEEQRQFTLRMASEYREHIDKRDAAWQSFLKDNTKRQSDDLKKVTDALEQVASQLSEHRKEFSVATEFMMRYVSQTGTGPLDPNKAPPQQRRPL